MARRPRSTFRRRNGHGPRPMPPVTMPDLALLDVARAIGQAVFTRGR